MLPLYLMSCPGCGQQLEPHAGHPDAAPWVCHHCLRAFWVCELSPDSRSRYRGTHFHDWGHSKEAFALRDKVAEEREMARRRGTSCLPEHIPLLELDHVRFLHDRFPLADSFKSVLASRLDGH